MLKKAGIIVVLSFCMACGNDKPPKPENLISEAKMEDMLYDLYVINASKGVNKSLLERKGFVPQNYILEKHNVDSIQFIESNNYYAFDIDKYLSIVENVKARLEKEKKKFEEVQAAEGLAAKKRRDSITAAREAKDSTELKLEVNNKIKKQLKKAKREVKLQ